MLTLMYFNLRYILLKYNEMSPKTSYIREWSENFSASTIDINNICKIFFPLSWYICHKHPCEIASHSIK